MNRSRKGFTLVELIVAMSIILILAALTVVGVRSMMESAKSSSTRVMLQNAESIFDEWRRAAGAAGRSPSQSYPQAILPGSLNLDNPNNDRASKTVRLSRAFMFRMNQLPAIRKMIGALPADRLLTFPEIDNAGYSGAMADLNDPAVFECVNGGRRYICYYHRPSASYPAPTGGAADAGTGAQWPDFWLESSNQTPVFRDAWGNPLIMFPACGFIIGTELHTSQGVLKIANAGVYWSATANYTAGEFVIHAGGDGVWRLYRCNTTHAATPATAPNTGSANWGQIPARPFFASAGPDGILAFDRGPDGVLGNADDVSGLQDNLYSSER